MERLCPRIGDGVMSVRDVVQAAAGVGGDVIGPAAAIDFDGSNDIYF